MNHLISFFCNVDHVTFLKKMEERGKKKTTKHHRIFPLYQLGATQFYKCASEGKKST